MVFNYQVSSFLRMPIDSKQWDMGMDRIGIEKKNSGNQTLDATKRQKEKLKVEQLNKEKDGLR